MQVVKVKAYCPRCGERKIVKRGHYTTKSKPRKHQRWYCIACNKNVVFSKNKPRGWDSKKYRLVKEMINKTRFPINKYDNRKNTKDAMYPSSREIVNILSKRYHLKVSKSVVAILIKKYRKYE